MHTVWKCVCIYVCLLLECVDVCVRSCHLVRGVGKMCLCCMANIHVYTLCFCYIWLYTILFQWCKPSMYMKIMTLLIPVYKLPPPITTLISSPPPPTPSSTKAHSKTTSRCSSNLVTSPSSHPPSLWLRCALSSTTSLRSDRTPSSCAVCSRGPLDTGRRVLGCGR